MSSLIRTIDKDKLEKIVIVSFSLREVLNKLNLTGRGHSYDMLKERLKKDNILYDHFLTRRINVYNSIGDILKENSTYVNSSNLKKKLLKYKLKENRCEICGQGIIFNNKKLSLHLDHINGKNNDNRIENLRILCPNCHSQTCNYSGKKNKKHDVTFKKCKRCDKIIDSQRKTGLCFKCYVNSPEKRLEMRTSQQYKRKFEVSKEKPMTHIGKMFGVSDNSIRNRAKFFGIIF